MHAIMDNALDALLFEDGVFAFAYDAVLHSNIDH